MRILIEWGNDFNANYGDEAYFASMVDLFREHLGGDVEISTFTGLPEQVAQRYGVRAIYSGGRLLRRLGTIGAALSAIARCDIYVWGGGQLLHDANGLYSVVYRLHRPCLAQFFRKPVMSYAIGVGPLAMPASRRLARPCLRKFDLLTVRDQHSLELLEQVGVDQPIHKTLDAAIILGRARPERVREILDEHGLGNGRPFLVYVPWGWAFRRGRSVLPVILRRERHRREMLAQYERHVSCVAEALDAMAARYDLDVLLIAQDPSPRHGRDTAMVRDIFERIQTKERVRRLGPGYAPKEIKGILGASQLVAGSRMHSIILATGEGVASCGVCFTEKLRQFAAFTGQTAHYINAEELQQGDRFTKVLEKAWNEREASVERIRQWLPQARQKIVANVHRLRNLLARRHASPARNIRSVVRRGLCTYCGTCYAFCPRNNILITRDRKDHPKPTVADEAVCRGCGLCLRICPGAELDMDQLASETFAAKASDASLGVVKRVVLTRACDTAIREKAAAGGTVTALARFALDEGLAGGVLATGLGTAEDPLAPFSIVATDRETVASCAGSHYQLHPTNAALRGALDGRQVAAVGLSCHVQGLRKAMREVPAAREGVSLIIGLFCGHNMDPLGTEHLLRRLGIPRHRLSRLRYRTRGMPGRLEATSRDGRTFSIPRPQWSYALSLFENRRCSLCPDPFNELADISVGDAFLPELRGQGGWNVTIVRSERGDRLVRRAEEAGILEVRDADTDAVTRSQTLKVYKRMRGVHLRVRLRRLCGRPTPVLRGVPKQDIRAADYVRELVLLAAQTAFASRFWARFLDPVIPLMRSVERRTGRQKDRLIGRSPGWRRDVFE